MKQFKFVDLFVLNNFVSFLFFRTYYNLTGKWNLDFDFIQPRRKFTTGAAPRQHCQRSSRAGIVLAVDPHEVCRGAGKASKGNTGIVLTSSAALELTFRLSWSLWRLVWRIFFLSFLVVWPTRQSKICRIVIFDQKTCFNAKNKFLKLNKSKTFLDKLVKLSRELRTWPKKRDWFLIADTLCYIKKNIN